MYCEWSQGSVVNNLVISLTRSQRCTFPHLVLGEFFSFLCVIQGQYCETLKISPSEPYSHFVTLDITFENEETKLNYFNLESFSTSSL